MTLGCHVDDVGVGGMRHDLTDVVRVAESHVREGLAPVGGLVDAITPADAVAYAGLARADPDDARILLEDGDVADCRSAVGVEDRLPGGAGVGRLPDAAGGRRHQHGGEVGVDRFNVRDPPRVVGGSDVAPWQVAQERPLAALGLARLERQTCRQQHGRGENQRVSAGRTCHRNAPP
jgi:hypothetical protein